jgi:DnaJ-class molecular chaperone
VCEAYEVLGNQTLKRVYDKFGLEGLRNGFKSNDEEFAGFTYSGNAFTIFRDFFGA